MRAHYMLGWSVVALALAAAGAAGVFDSEGPSRQMPKSRLEATATAIDAGAPVSSPFLTVTYVLVSSEAERAVWDNVEETINQRELLTRLAIEVFVVTNAEQEAQAYTAIEAARARYPWNEHVVQDLR